MFTKISSSKKQEMIQSNSTDKLIYFSVGQTKFDEIAFDEHHICSSQMPSNREFLVESFPPRHQYWPEMDSEPITGQSF